MTEALQGHSTKGRGIQGHDPRTGAPVGDPVPATGAEHVDALVQAAFAAFETWRDTGRAARAAALEAVAETLDAHVTELVALADSETALGTTRLTGEVARTTGQLRLFAQVLRDGSYQGIVIEHAEGRLVGIDGEERGILLLAGKQVAAERQRGAGIEGCEAAQFMEQLLHQVSHDRRIALDARTASGSV